MIWKPKDNDKMKNDDQEKMIQGFDIDLDNENLKRIDRLVDRYESEIVKQLNSEYVKKTKRSDRIADFIARFGGSWSFIIMFASFLTVWIVWNTVLLTSGLRFDKPPFILLNLCLSFIAAFQAPFIMMSQNRSAARDKHESIIDFAINYKSGQEIDDMQGHLHRLEREVAVIKKLLKEKEETEKRGG
ncbi:MULTISPECIES: DUF1003 domain-containing protein [unclassified Sporolactobacillus]|uniref:DUF1003 domain-containing protein n=1 Tax=unclassified Sporolactobacillus TaxID=2628533 RepID=UPI002367B5C6|nr:DUF1003 domain-containing protein [Sporolactobacillus sp. CQH2019]MDD9148713.1 DUF1003 domain-containing protein [Sporolactobacillus sp. CQH2019]